MMVIFQLILLCGDSYRRASYTVTYNVSDDACFRGDKNCNVTDTTAPVITLVGDAQITVEVGTTYTDLGATASDNYDGDITTDIVTVNNVDTSVIGSYTVTYNVTDTRWCDQHQ